MLQTPASPRALGRSIFVVEEDATTAPSGSTPALRIDTSTHARPKKHGRHKLWIPEKLSASDRANKEALLKKYGISVSTRDRILVDYHTFCVLNNLPPKAALGDVVGQMHGKLKIGTIDTYSAYVAAEFPSAVHRRVRKAVQRAHADEDVEGAPRFAREHLRRLVFALQTVLLRRCCLLLLLTGIRPVAGRRMRRRNFGVMSKKNKEHALVLGVAWDKTVAKRANMQHLQLPRWLAMDVSQQDLHSIFGTGPHGETPFEGVTCQAINEALREVWEKDRDTTTVPPTSYSFRRAYVQAVFEHYGNDSEALKKYTLHFGDQVVKAHYVDWFSQCEKPKGSEAPTMSELPENGDLDGLEEE